MMDEGAWGLVIIYCHVAWALEKVIRCKDNRTKDSWFDIEGESVSKVCSLLHFLNSRNVFKVFLCARKQQCFFYFFIRWNRG